MSRNKLYYPKSHIVNNLRTDGKEWMLENGTEYKGYYHRYVDGSVLTGAVYDKIESKKLIPYVSTVTQPNNVVYDSLKKKSSYRTPHNVVALPTKDDYKAGRYTRYFFRRRNYSSYEDIIEVDKKQFDLWKNPNGGIDENIYDALELNWKLTGPLNDKLSNTGTIEVYGVADTNERIVKIKDTTFPGLKNFLTDYIEYTVYSNLTSPEIKKLFGNTV